MKAWIARDFDGTLMYLGKSLYATNLNKTWILASVMPRQDLRLLGPFGDTREGIILHPNTFKNKKWSDEPREVVLKVH